MTKPIAHLGGIFIYSENPKELADWYKVYFDFDYEYTDEYKAYYLSFYYKEENTEKRRYVAWSILSSKDRPQVQQKLFCINYRVNDLVSFCESLRIKGVEVKGPENHNEGSFAWLNDLEGNYIELWQDVD